MISHNHRQPNVQQSHAIAHGGEFVQRHAEAGEPGFVEMWKSIGGMARFDRRREWWARCRDQFATVIGM
jgi:hypothetical protein